MQEKIKELIEMKEVIEEKNQDYKNYIFLI